LKEPSKILIIRPSALGDVCRSVPVLASLRRAYPVARIDWLVQDTFADAIWYHPALTNAVPFPRNELSAKLKRGGLWQVLEWMNSALFEPGYELVVDCQGLGRSGLFAWWTRAATRVGYARPEGRELSWLGVNTRVTVPPGMHAVDRMLELVETVDVDAVRDMRLYTGPQERAFAARELGERRYAVLAPTSRWPGKLWPAERYVEVARGLLAKRMGRVEAVAIVGGEKERGQCGPLLQLAQSEPRVIDLIGETSVGELMAVVQGSALVIASDSAALHMAVGFDRPAIGLYGPTRVDLVGPYTGHTKMPGSVVIQHVHAAERLDHKKEREGRAMMGRIKSAEVIAAAEKLLARSEAS
jgi:heptosyltransferase I